MNAFSPFVGGISFRQGKLHFERAFVQGRNNSQMQSSKQSIQTIRARCDATIGIVIHFTEAPKKNLSSAKAYYSYFLLLKILGYFNGSPDTQPFLNFQGK